MISIIALAPITANPDLVVGLIAAILGGMGVKIFDYYSNRSEVNVDDATRLRQELREELQRRQEDIDRMQVELEEYKEKVFDLAYAREELELKNQALMVMLVDLRSKLEDGE